MMDLADWHAAPPYGLDHHAKGPRLTETLLELTAHHANHCEPYGRMLQAQGFDPRGVTSLADLPFLPVRLFKEIDLLSIPRDQVVKTMTSSGTSGQTPSRIYLDRDTSAHQMRALTRIVSAVTDAQRMPMIVVDSPAVIQDRALFSARGAGILGFSIFARDRLFALDEHMQPNLDALSAFLDKHAGSPILVFGFTFMVWQHLCKPLMQRGQTLELSNAVLVHGGGWKTLMNESVSPTTFKQGLLSTCGIHRVHDYYGMVEQTGSIAMECERGHLHVPVYSDVIVRCPHDFSVAGLGERGLLQMLSVLPQSYPGHSLLTEDEGVVLGEDDCPCGRRGKYFKVLGRIPKAELRGCSDTYAAGKVATHTREVVNAQ